jgi:hypothetical protein
MTFLSIVCYIIGFIITIGAYNSLKTDMAKERAKNVKVLFSGLIIIFLGWVFWPSNDTPNNTPTVEDIGSMDVDAYVMSQDFITKQLKAPATADFPVGSDGHVKYEGDSVFYVNSYVDAQNSFGANIRTNYSGRIKYMGKDNWRNISLNLIEN